MTDKQMKMADKLTWAVRDLLDGKLNPEECHVVGRSLGAINEAINTITTENEELREEVERLINENVVYESIIKGLTDRCERIQQECDQLKAYVNDLRTAALSAISFMPSGRTKADLRDAYDTTQEQYLAAHDVEVIERELKTLGISKQPSGALLGYSEVEGKWIQLRHQAVDGKD